tara:strand:- start:702 stop:1091 length:390 start_codon:yes stop_codon:yes gene_type:complete
MKDKKITCYLPKSVEKRVNRTRQDKPRDWVNVYMYSDNRQKKCYGTEFKVNNEIQLDGGQSYNKNTLYKDHNISKKDEMFDYYKILKTSVKKKNYVKKRKKALNKKHETSDIPPISYLNVIQGKVVVKF